MPTALDVEVEEFHWLCIHVRDNRGTPEDVASMRRVESSSTERSLSHCRVGNVAKVVLPKAFEQNRENRSRDQLRYRLTKNPQDSYTMISFYFSHTRAILWIVYYDTRDIHDATRSDDVFKYEIEISR